MPTPENSLVAVLVSKLDDNLLEDWEYRSSVMTFDAMLPKGHAECLAMIDLLCRYPDVLKGNPFVVQAKAASVVVIQAEIDGATQYLLSSESNAARQYLVDLGGKEIAVLDLADVLHTQYAGLAMLASVG